LVIAEDPSAAQIGGSRVPATAELSPSVASRQCPRLQSQVSGEHVQADWSRQGERHGVIVNIPQELRSSYSIGRIRNLKRHSTFVTDAGNRPPAVR
jgi:hypothetical protein